MRVALHDQRPPRERDLSLRDYVLSGCREPLELEAELGRLEQAMAAAATSRALDRYATSTPVRGRGGYGWRERARSVVHGLGFADDDLDRPLRTFSGGQLTRASLARALAAQPDLLLLDEPTNHLDIESLEWLEQTLLVARRRDRHGRPRPLVPGGGRHRGARARGRAARASSRAPGRSGAASRPRASWRSAGRSRSSRPRSSAWSASSSASATRPRKARQAQSRIKALDKMERIERDPRDGRALGFEFKAPERSGRVIFELEDGRLEVGRPRKVLLDDAELWLERGEHVSLVGPNGTGKTTLIEALAGRRELDGGRLRSGHNVQVGYLSQHGEELGGPTPRGDGARGRRQAHRA